MILRSFSAGGKYLQNESTVEEKVSHIPPSRVVFGDILKGSKQEALYNQRCEIEYFSLTTLETKIPDRSYGHFQRRHGNVTF